MTAYVSNKCQESASFVRLLRERRIRARVVTIEDADEIPWYVDTVPSLVVQTRDGLDVYAADDAFAAIQSERSEQSERRTAQPQPPHDRGDEDDEVGCMGLGEAVFEDVDGGSVISCVGGSNYESLLSKEDERAVTSKTVAAWERNLRAEAACRESSADTVEKKLEMLMKTRGEQQQEQLAPKSEPSSTKWGHRY